MSLNTIREVTEITGITVNALRYYDDKGLLLLDQLSADEDVKDDLLDKMFAAICRINETGLGADRRMEVHR